MGKGHANPAIHSRFLYNKLYTMNQRYTEKTVKSHFDTYRLYWHTGKKKWKTSVKTPNLG